jgi:hypothetical protein
VRLAVIGVVRAIHLPGDYQKDQEIADFDGLKMLPFFSLSIVITLS